MGNLSFNASYQIYLQQIFRVVEKTGYMYSQNKQGITIFIPKLPEAISVAEIVETEISYKVIEYNHHLLQGDIEGKKEIKIESHVNQDDR